METNSSQAAFGKTEIKENLISTDKNHSQMTEFQDRVAKLRAHHEELITRQNEPLEWGQRHLHTL